MQARYRYNSGGWRIRSHVGSGVTRTVRAGSVLRQIEGGLASGRWPGVVARRALAQGSPRSAAAEGRSGAAGRLGEELDRLAGQVLEEGTPAQGVRLRLLVAERLLEEGLEAEAQALAAEAYASARGAQRARAGALVERAERAGRVRESSPRSSRD